MFALQTKEKSFLQNSRTLEKCMSWPGSRRKTDDTLLSVTVAALCQEQMLLSAGLVARPAASQRSSLEDELAQLTVQPEPGTSSEHSQCTEPQSPVKTVDAKRYE